MQQACVDDVLMANYSVNDTDSLLKLTDQALNEVIKYKCEPFDCNGNGTCTDGACVCKPGTPYCTSVIISNVKSRDSVLSLDSLGPRGSAVERQSLASVLSPSCARPVADG